MRMGEIWDGEEMTNHGQRSMIGAITLSEWTAKFNVSSLVVYPKLSGAKGIMFWTRISIFRSPIPGAIFSLP